MVNNLNSKKSNTNFIQSVDRALRILEVFKDNDKELGVTEIAKILDLNKSTAFGLLTTLENRGYVEQNLENGKYHWGFKLMELGFASYESIDIVQIARPELRELSDKFKETVHIVVRDKSEVVYIDKFVGGNDAVGVVSRVGKRNPLYCTGVGKCILAFMDESEVDKVLSQPLKKYTKNTVTDVDLIKKELIKIREQGCSFDREEIELGLCCVAAPIKDHTGKVVAAISLSGPSIRMSKEKINSICSPVKDAANRISRSLGYRG